MKEGQVEQSARLQKLVKALNLNQSAFAKSLGMTQPNISRMVNGESNVSVEVLLGISKRYEEVNLHWLLTGDGNMFLEELKKENSEVNNLPGSGKGRLEELEERVENLEKIVRSLLNDLGS
jgi:transcriptional regulator with XRE-family HTH domain